VKSFVPICRLGVYGLVTLSCVHERFCLSTSPGAGLLVSSQDWRQIQAVPLSAVDTGQLAFDPHIDRPEGCFQKIFLHQFTSPITVPQHSPRHYRLLNVDVFPTLQPAGIERS